MTVHVKPAALSTPELLARSRLTAVVVDVARSAAKGHPSQPGLPDPVVRFTLADVSGKLHTFEFDLQRAKTAKLVLDQAIKEASGGSVV